MAELQPNDVPSTSNPLFSGAQLWNDFWAELIKYLPPKLLFHLSCISKDLWRFTWTKLIPVSGMKFGRGHESRICGYLSRVPFLSQLDLVQCDSSYLHKVLPKTSNLKKLMLPRSGPNGLSVDLITHLTDLESLETDIFIDRFPEALPKTFKKLTSLHSLLLRKDLSEFITALGLSTQLKTLQLRAPDPQHLDMKLWMNLTNLEQLTLTSGSYTDRLTPYEIPTTWTNLKFLKCYWYPCPQNLECFPGLEFLSLNVCGGDAGTRFQKIRELTNLRTLTCEEFTDEQDCDFSPLTNLTELTIGDQETYVDSLKSLSVCRKLKKLNLPENQTGLQLQTLNVLCKEIPPLEQLTITTDRLYVFESHPHLQTLFIHLPDARGVVEEFSRLTDLQELGIWGFLPPGEVYHLSSLTNLRTLQLNTRVDEVLPNLTFLTSLKELILPFSDVSSDGLEVISTHFSRLQKLDMSSVYSFSSYREEDWRRFPGLETIDSVLRD